RRLALGAGLSVLREHVVQHRMEVLNDSVICDRNQHVLIGQLERPSTVESEEGDVRRSARSRVLHRVQNVRRVAASRDRDEDVSWADKIDQLLREHSLKPTSLASAETIGMLSLRLMTRKRGRFGA